MNFIDIVRFVSGLLLLLAIVASTITFLPEAEEIVQSVIGVSGLLGVAGVLSPWMMWRFPVEHWVHQPIPWVDHICWGICVLLVLLYLLTQILR